MSVTMRTIDAHTHVFPQYADMAVRVMDLCGIEQTITLEWHDGFGPTLEKHLEIFAAHPGRFVVFGNVDWSRIDEKDFGATAAAQLERDVALGTRGLKVYKALGLEYRRASGELWKIAAPELDPIWSQAGESGIPVLIHAADPAAFWQPVDAENFWNGVLYGEYAWWSYCGKNVPGRRELIADRNRMIARHPETTFICPHMGSNSDDLETAADDLDRLPNIYYDISARIPALGFSKERAARSRQFLTKYQDRILFGTDSIYDDINVPTGMQAQCLYQPGENLPGEKVAKEKYIETTARFFRSHIDFLTTDEIQTDPPFNRNLEGFSIAGLALSADVCEKILYRNISRLIPGEVPN
ncbi:MAG: amidohydrolase family protein [Gemmatimonadetes bacterium]|jgi:uncharacterized protein|nr:amidohydrolase family protein [Gemmatimonadota bacterium]